MTKKLLVRKAKINDAQFIADANCQMALETEGLRLNEDTVIAGVKAVFENTSRGFYLLAETDGRKVGCLLVTYEWSDWRNKQTAWIQSLYVLPEFRNQGAFKTMFAKVDAMVQSGKFAGVRLYVDSTNNKAQKIYKKFGMNGDHYMLFEKMSD